MIEVKNLYFKYDEKFILKNINIEIKEGSFTAIIGANGSGKTTLAKHFNALLLPTKGDVIVDGLNTKKYEINARKKVGFVFQNFEDQMVHSIVEEDIAFGLENLELENNEIIDIVEKTLNKLKIKNIEKDNVNMISSGQKQLVALAGVLAMKPKYIVFDEPTTMLDINNKKNIMSIMKKLNKKDKITVILITNILSDLKYADNVILIKKGTVIFDGKKSMLNKKILKEAGLNA
ncbi:ATP-binding cassette domain-containing protein [Candidatus Woesearchaeota archaeon]|nr:ATP-binding cassette domain-containing protein [Candidatus Woesearchaeota archaeon]